MDFRPIRAHAGSYLYFKYICYASSQWSNCKCCGLTRCNIAYLHITTANCEVSGHFGKEKQIPWFFLGYTLSGITWNKIHTLPAPNRMEPCLKTTQRKLLKYVSVNEFDARVMTHTSDVTKPQAGGNGYHWSVLFPERKRLNICCETCNLTLKA